MYNVVFHGYVYERTDVISANQKEGKLWNDLQ